jgi:hypothetical protein
VTRVAVDEMADATNANDLNVIHQLVGKAL